MAGRGSVWGGRGWIIPPGEGGPVDLGRPGWPEILVRVKIICVLDGGYYFRVGARGADGISLKTNSTTR
jgi:hypothetical protein